MQEKTISVYTSNLPKNISKAEIEGLFFRAGRIMDVFIPVEKGSREGKGFAFVRFGTKKEAERATELVNGRCWGGRRLQMNIAHNSSRGEVDKVAEKPRSSGKGDNRTYLEALLGPEKYRGSNDIGKGEGQDYKSRPAGWIVNDGKEKGVRVASWVAQDQKKALFCSIVGFLKTHIDGQKQAEKWLERCWKKMADKIQMIA